MKHIVAAIAMLSAVLTIEIAGATPVFQLTAQSERGDFIGQGQTYSFTKADGVLHTTCE